MPVGMGEGCGARVGLAVVVVGAMMVDRVSGRVVVLLVMAGLVGLLGAVV